MLWRTERGELASVDYRERGSSGEWRRTVGVVRPTNTGLVENEVVLRNLRPKTVYEYRILTDGRRLTNRVFRFLSPVAVTDTTFEFYAVGDIGEPVELEGEPAWLDRAIIGSKRPYSFGLLLGDIVYPEGRSAVYDERLFRHFTGSFPAVPVFPVLGNHDWFDPQDNYEREWKLPGNEHYYNFRSGNVRFFALDSGPNGEVYDYDRQVAWLREGLAKTELGVDWTVVYLHHNGKSCTYKQDYAGVVSLYPIFAEYGVDLVLNGHAHTYERLRPMQEYGGFTSITIGSGGKLRGMAGDPTPFVPDATHCRHPDLVAKSVHDWVYLGLWVDGRKLHGTAYRTRDGAVVDEFVLD